MKSERQKTTSDINLSIEFANHDIHLVQKVTITDFGEVQMFYYGAVHYAVFNKEGVFVGAGRVPVNASFISDEVTEEEHAAVRLSEDNALTIRDTSKKKAPITLEYELRCLLGWEE